MSEIGETNGTAVTAAEFYNARKRLRMTQAQLAEALQLGKDGKRAVRRWEHGERPISGPVAVAITMMREKLEERDQ